jgi:peptidoglycan/xylan/chitin deacetylase (PgdA/CDA1 family)
MKQRTIVASLFCALALSAWGEVEFHGLDLGKDDLLLFSAKAQLPSDGSFDTLFAADLNKGGVAQLTVYPEHMFLVEGGRKLQVQNRYGLFRSDAALTALYPVAGYPSFARGSSIRSGRLLPVAASPDGNYVLSAAPSSAAYSRLVLFDVAKGAELVVSSKVEYSVEEFPARWSPDSRHFVYEKGGSLFYFSIEQYAGSRILDEEYRRIGEGSIGCARWGSDGSLFYLKDTSLFRILPAEFFTQALYRGIAGMGVLAGKTPFPFDPNFDDFWVSREGSRVILSKGGRNLFLLYLDPDDFGSDARVTALPYLFLQGDTMVKDVLWPAGGAVTVFTGSFRDGTRTAGAYRIAAPADPSLLGLAPNVTRLDAGGAKELVLSPDETKVAVVTAAGLTIRSYADWSSQAEIKAPGALHCLWISEDKLVVAGAYLIETVSPSSGARTLVALSQAEAYGRADDGSILAKSGGTPYRRPGLPAAATVAAPATSSTAAPGAASAALADGWTAQPAYSPIATASSSENFRVYLDALAAGAYRNTVMIRSVKALGTRPLFPPPAAAYSPFPARDDPRESGIFDHGSRIRRRELALVFNALDSSAGLVQVLNTLKDYDVAATFFVNGEFVRQSPGAARLLAGSGNEIASMFFSAVDPTDARFRIDRDYVRRGLARAEDEWFAATGKELSLLWHTPYYSVNTDIIEAGASMNYTYVGRDVDPLDWVSKTDAAKMPGSYFPAHAIVEKVLAEAKPGSIIPIRLGAPVGGRDDYLYRELALLVDALQGAGYAIVPVSALIEHAE